MIARVLHHYPKIKICGLTNWRDAAVAVEAGADALGFVLYPGSRRFIEPAKVAEWFADIPPFIDKVAVTVNEPETYLQQLVEDYHFDYIQLHGDETPGFCRQLARKVPNLIKALGVKEGETLPEAATFGVRAILLDAVKPGQYGGTGATFDWAQAVQFCASNPKTPLILSGGLHAENVEAAIRAVRPFAVDVASGVETSPGKKSHEAIFQFVEAARSASRPT